MSEADFIEEVVFSFYEKAKNDILIGYHFRHIQDFETHIPRICAFWELQLLSNTSRPLEKPFDVLNIHTPLKIKKGELGRWMVLFKKTLSEIEVNSPHRELLSRWEEKLFFFESVFTKFFSLN